MSERGIWPLVLLFAGGWLLYLLAPILTPFIAAALLAYVGDPLVDRLQRLKLSRTTAVVVTFVLLFLVVGAVTVLVIPLAREQGSALAAKLPQYVHWLESRFMPNILEFLGIESTNGKIGFAAILAEYGDKVAALVTGTLGTVSRSGGALLTMIINLALVPVLTFYLMRDYDLIIERVGDLVPERAKPAVFQLAGESDRALGGFLRGQLMVMLGLALIYSTGLSIIGLDSAIAIGVVAGLVSFVPYLGFFVGIVLAGLSALVQEQSWLPVLFVFIVFAVGQIIEGTLLTPKMVGDRIGLHPVLVIFAVMAGGQLFGFFGILMALPVAALVSVLVRHIYSHYSDDEEGGEDDPLFALAGEDKLKPAPPPDSEDHGQSG